MSIVGETYLKDFKPFQCPRCFGLFKVGDRKSVV